MLQFFKVSNDKAFLGFCPTMTILGLLGFSVVLGEHVYLTKKNDKFDMATALAMLGPTGDRLSILLNFLTNA